MTDYHSTSAPAGWPPEDDSPTSTTASTAAEQARNVGGTAVDQTKSVARTAADEARGVAQDAKGEVRKLVGDARDQLRTQAGQQSDRLATSLQDVGHQLRTMAEKADDPESPVTNITRQAADTAERFASRLQDGGFDQMIDDVKRLARNRPGLFLAGALGAGFLIGRMVKAVDMGQVVKGEQGQQQPAASELYGQGTAGSIGTADEFETFATSQPSPYEQPSQAYPVPDTAAYPATEGTGYPGDPTMGQPGTTEPRPDDWNR